MAISKGGLTRFGKLLLAVRCSPRLRHLRLRLREWAAAAAAKQEAVLALEQRLGLAGGEEPLARQPRAHLARHGIGRLLGLL